MLPMINDGTLCVRLSAFFVVELCVEHDSVFEISNVHFGAGAT